MTDRTQLTELAKPFADRLISPPAKGKYGSYVSHDVVTQKLLLTVGPFSMKVVELIRGRADEIKTEKATYPAVENAVVGCVLRCTFTIDGREVEVEDTGDVEAPAMKETDGARAKDAVSDAIKRVAMRVGCGLHLWSGKDYILHDQLLKTQPRKEVDSPGEGAPSHPPTDIGGSAQPDPAQGQPKTGSSNRDSSSDSLGHDPSSEPAPASSQNGDPDSQGARVSTEALRRLREGGEAWRTIAPVVSRVALAHTAKVPETWDQLLANESLHYDVALELKLISPGQAAMPV